MHISLPQSVAGAKDAYFVLELAFERADVARTIEVEADAPLEVLDLEGGALAAGTRSPVASSDSTSPSA